jgi:alpha-L-fucosidase 2
MDMQIIRALFDAYAEAAELLGVDGDLRDEVRAKRQRLAPLQIGRHGQVQEWIEDWEEIEPEHRHLSHLWGLFPGNEITPESTPDFAAAAETTIDLRGTGGCGWSMGWKMALWARLLDGPRALAQFATLIGDDTLPNLFSLCGRALQVDGNFGATAAIAEMLVQSQGGRIHFLPALPDAWAAGSATGFRARGGFEVDFRWESGKLATATIHSRNGNTVRIRSDEALVVSSEGRQISPRVLTGGLIEFDTRAGSTYLLSGG